MNEIKEGRKDERKIERMKEEGNGRKKEGRKKWMAEE